MFSTSRETSVGVTNGSGSVACAAVGVRATSKFAVTIDAVLNPTHF